MSSPPTMSTTRPVRSTSRMSGHDTSSARDSPTTSRPCVTSSVAPAHAAASGETSQTTAPATSAGDGYTRRGASPSGPGRRSRSVSRNAAADVPGSLPLSRSAVSKTARSRSDSAGPASTVLTRTARSLRPSSRASPCERAVSAAVGTTYGMQP